MESLIAGEPEALAARRGPSLVFAVVVIGGVALLTAGAVGTLFVEPSQGAPEAPPTIAADQPILTASLDPLLPPVRKVTTKSFPALKQDAARPPSLPAPQTEPVQMASAAEVDALEQQDPRWAIPGEKADEAVDSVLPAVQDETVTTGATVPADDQAADEADDRTDETRTAAIAPDEVKPKRAGKRNKQVEEKAVEEKPLPPGVGASTRPVQVSKGVNMRSRPKSGSGVLMVVPKAAVVQVVNCKAWCEIIYKGRRGYIYKSYIGGQRAATKTKAASNKTKTVKTVYTVDAKPKTETPVEEPRIKFTSQRLQ